MEVSEKKEYIVVYEMKMWADSQPNIPEEKGGARDVRPKKNILTSNNQGGQNGVEQSDVEASVCRFKCVKFSSFP